MPKKAKKTQKTKATFVMQEKLITESPIELLIYTKRGQLYLDDQGFHADIFDLGLIKEIEEDLANSFQHLCWTEPGKAAHFSFDKKMFMYFSEMIGVL